MIIPLWCSFGFIAFTVMRMPFADGHMEMKSPVPRRSRFGSSSNPDYDMVSPLSESQYPCKGFLKESSVMTVSAGSSIPVEFSGGATHGGGHCQFALSYDEGETFVVIQDILRECLAGSGLSFSVDVPADVPSGDAIFAWTWINAVGNREYYMNCADITITDGASSFSGPELLVVNLPPRFPTIIPEFSLGGDRAELFDQRPTVSVKGD